MNNEKMEMIKQIAVFVDDMYGTENSYEDYFDDLEVIARRVISIQNKEKRRIKELIPKEFNYKYANEILRLNDDYGLARLKFSEVIGVSETSVKKYVYNEKISENMVHKIEYGYLVLMNFIAMCKEEKLYGFEYKGSRPFDIGSRFSRFCYWESNEALKHFKKYFKEYKNSGE